MSAAALIAELRRDGVELVLDGDKLRYRPAQRVDLVQRAALAAHKREVIELLAAEARRPLEAAVVIEAHGQRFVVIPDGEPAERWSTRGLAPLNVSEVQLLSSATAGRPMPPESVRALALTKLHFPGASVLEARVPARAKR